VDGLVEQLSGIPVHLVLLPDGYYSSARRIIKAIDGKKHRTELKNKFHIVFNEINHKIDMKVKKDCQVIISPLLQSMLGFRQVYSRRGSMLQIE
jgi:aspartate/methionine/tyrosine aminotransferase